MAIGTAAPSSFDGRTSIAVGMTNTGNFRLHPDARLVVTNSPRAGRVGPSPSKWAPSTPATAPPSRALLSTALAPGHYTVAADLSDSTPGWRRNASGLSIDVRPPPTTLPPPPPCRRHPAQPAIVITRGLPITLAVGLVLAALLAGVAATTVGAYLRRRRAGAQNGDLDNRKGTK